MQNAFLPLPFPLNLTLLYSIFIPTIIALILALALAVNRPLSGKTSGYLASFALLLPLIFFANHLTLMFLANMYPSVYTFTAVSETYNWISFGSTTIHFGLLADELSLPFVVLISFVSFLATVYSIGYMKDEENLSAYYVFIVLFATSMFGAVLSTNLIQFFIFYEAMNFPAFFLVLIWGTRKGKRTSLQYIFYMFTGALCLLGGIVWLYGYTGSLDILQLPTIITSISLPIEAATIIALLMFIGFGTKMAIVPFHNWLPNFHAEAPSSISALLSAVMIEIGLYGLMRILIPYFPDVFLSWSGILSAIASFTMIYGALMALVQTDFKRILAYSSVNQMGYMLLGLASSTYIGTFGALIHILTHGVAKAALFLASGALIHYAGTKDVKLLGGLAHKMPITAIVIIIGGLSIAGAPPLAGFSSEWLLFVGSFSAGFFYPALIGVISTALTAGYYLWSIRRIFYGPGLQAEAGTKSNDETLKVWEEIHDPPRVITIPLSLLVLFVGLLGVFPAIGGWLTQTAAGDIITALTVIIAAALTGV